MSKNLLFHSLPISVLNLKNKTRIPDTDIYFSSIDYTLYYNHSKFPSNIFIENIFNGMIFLIKILPVEKFNDFFNFHLKKYLVKNNYNNEIQFVSILTDFISENENNNKNSMYYDPVFSIVSIFQENKQKVNVIKVKLKKIGITFLDKLYCPVKDKALSKKFKTDKLVQLSKEYKIKFVNYVKHLLEINAKFYVYSFILNIDNKIELSCTNNSEKITEYKKQIKYYSNDINLTSLRIIQEDDFYFYFSELVFSHDIMFDFFLNKKGVSLKIIENDDFVDLLKTMKHKNIIKILKDKIISLEQEGQNIKIAKKTKSPTVPVLSLYYYYMSEAKLIPLFYQYKGKTIIQAMEYVLKKDGHDISVSNFKNTFYAIGKGTDKDPVTKRNIEKVIKLLSPKAQAFAKKDLKSFE